MSEEPKKPFDLDDLINASGTRSAVRTISTGVAIMVLCGSCTVAVVMNGGFYGLEYVVGGLPIFVGFVVFVTGLLRYRKFSTNRDGRNE